MLRLDASATTIFPSRLLATDRVRIYADGFFSV
jgi:hypothetical protein